MKSWMPTRLSVGEGRVEWGSNRRMHPFRCTGVMGTARWEGGPGNRGRPVSVGGRAPNAVASTDGLSVVKKTIEQFVERALRLYEQEPGAASSHSRFGMYVRRWAGWAGVK